MDSNEKDDYYFKEIAKRLREEVFVELDRRVKSAEKRFSKELEEHAGEVSEKVEEQVKTEIVHTLASQRALGRAVHNFKSFQDKLRLYHKIPYAVMVVSGILLFWYGGWSIIRSVPILSDGPLALALGVLLLFLTGTIYKKLVE